MGTYNDVNPNALDMTGWNTVFFDGFNGTQLDWTKWPITYGGSMYWNNAFWWDNGQLSVGNGALTIGMDEQSNGIWTVGGLSTMPYQGAPAGHGNTFLYGRAEIRAKTSVEVEGAGPCFLLWPADNSWPPEVDILETPKGGQGMITNHWVGPTGTAEGRGYKSHFYDLDHSQWHTYAVDWTPDRLTFYVDGVEVYTTTENIPHIPMSVGLQGHVGREDDGWYGNPNDTNISSVDIEVDWVRVSQYTGGNPPKVPSDPVVPPKPREPANLTVGTGTDSLVLKISQDAYQGDAQYIVRVDGVQVGGTLTAAALRSAGQADTVTVRGDWAAGAHSVQVELTNDLYGGAADKDRNLHVESATYNGTAVSGAKFTLWGGGPQAFSFTEAAPVPPKPSLTGTAASETINGLAGNDVIEGLAGNDTLRGFTGNDTISGGDGADRIVGGKGDDVVTLGQGRDVAIWITGDGNDRVRDFTPGADQLELRAIDKANVTVKVVDAGVEVSIASGGKVLLEGLKGLKAGDVVAGTEELPAIGTAIVTPPTGGDTPTGPALPATTATVNGTAGDDWLKGGTGADLMLGGAGSDDLQGGGGNDVLRGGAGQDGLTGGAGQDMFVFARGDAQDWVVDFTPGQDKVRLEGITAGQVVQTLETRWGMAGLELDLGNGEEMFLQGVTAKIAATDLVFA